MRELSSWLKSDYLPKTRTTDIGLGGVPGGKAMYRHAVYREPELGLVPDADAAHHWCVRHRGETLARFDDLTKAAAYLAFMRGATIEPRVFA